MFLQHRLGDKVYVTRARPALPSQLFRGPPRAISAPSEMRLLRIFTRLCIPKPVNHMASIFLRSKLYNMLVSAYVWVTTQALAVPWQVAGPSSSHC